MLSRNVGGSEESVWTSGGIPTGRGGGDGGETHSTDRALSLAAQEHHQKPGSKDFEKYLRL